MKPLLRLLPAMLLAGFALASAAPPGWKVYSLTVSEHRRETKTAAFLDAARDLYFETEMTLFARIGTPPAGGSEVVVWADSISFFIQKPVFVPDFHVRRYHALRNRR